MLFAMARSAVTAAANKIKFTYRLKVKKGKGEGAYSSLWIENPSQSYRESVTRHMASHSVTCHPTQVNAPRLNPSHAGRYSIYLPRRDGRLSLPLWLVIYRDGLPVGRQSSVQVVTTR